MLTSCQVGFSSVTLQDPNSVAELTAPALAAGCRVEMVLNTLQAGSGQNPAVEPFAPAGTFREIGI